MEWTHTMAVLERYAGDFKQRLTDRLIRDDKYVTGSLIASLQVLPVATDKEISVWLVSEDYLQYINDGTKAHWPPREPIEKWIEDKGIQPYPDRNGKLPTVQGLAFLIGRAMAGKSPNQASLKNPEGGTLPDPVVDETLVEVNEEYMAEIESAIMEDVEDEVRAIIISTKIW